MTKEQEELIGRLRFEARARAHAQPERIKIRATWWEAQQAAQVRRGVRPEAIKRIARALDFPTSSNREAADGGCLTADFIITLPDDTTITVAEILADPEKWHKEEIPDPVEPDYRGDKRIAIIYTDGVGARIYSHAHGGVLYELIDNEELTRREAIMAAAMASTFDPRKAAEIARLALLREGDYREERAAARAGLGMGLQALDSIVSKARKAGVLEEADNVQGRPIEFSDPEPSPEPVASGAALADQIRFVFTDYLILPLHADVVLTLWVIHTYSWLKVGEFSPLIHVQAPLPQCGKTRVGEVASTMAFRPWHTGGHSSAVLVRLIAQDGIALIADELDLMSDEKRAAVSQILNEGYRREGKFTMCVGDDHAPRGFQIYGPKILIGIGSKLPESTLSRTIPIRLRRRLKAEVVKKFRVAKVTRENLPLREAIRRWSDDNIAAMQAIEPEIPDELDDRSADIWEVLLAIADQLGGGWPQAAREAAVALNGADASAREATEDGAKSGLQLLRDIKQVFDAKDAKTAEVLGTAKIAGVDANGSTPWDDPADPKISSADLCGLLCTDETMPWSDFEPRRGRFPESCLTQRELARLLRPFEIYPRSIKFPAPAGVGGAKGVVVRGFFTEAFREAFARYA